MDWTKLDAVADELSATRAEVLGLVLLVLGGVVVSWLVVQGGGSHSAASGPVTVASPSSAAADVANVGEADAADGAGNAVDGATGANATDRATVAPPAVVVVHVTGAVATPGVVELVGGARVVDAVAAAGGPTGDAALDALNMARPVVDGERVHVPTPQEVADGLVPEPGVAAAGPDTGGTGAAGAAPSARDAEGRLDLNLATPSELEELPGVGPVLAQRIAAWRDANGGFEAVGQLREVTGIGEQTFQGLADLVVAG